VLFNIRNTKDAIIFNKLWPAIIFANNRTAKLKARAKYDITSITIKKGNKAGGTPVGTKSKKNFVPCKSNPVEIKNTKIEKEKKNVVNR
jgi:hypothetical protein